MEQWWHALRAGTWIQAINEKARVYHWRALMLTELLAVSKIAEWGATMQTFAPWTFYDLPTHTLTPPKALRLTSVLYMCCASSSSMLNFLRSFASNLCNLNKNVNYWKFPPDKMTAFLWVMPIETVPLYGENDRSVFEFPSQSGILCIKFCISSLSAASHSGRVCS